MSSNQFLIDAATRHQVFLQRYGGGQSKKAQKSLLRLRREINARLMSEPTDFQRGRMEALLSDIDEMIAIAFGQISGSIKKGAYDLAISEAAFSAGLFNRAAKSSIDFSTPAEAQIIAAVEGIPMAAPAGMASVTIGDALADFGIKKANQVKQIILDGAALGDTSQQIAQKVGENINTLQRRQIDTLVRTVTNHASSVARAEVYEDNADILDGYRWIATLDSRTTFICASRDQEVYQPGVGPMPPAHWGCRSTTVPVVKDEFTLGPKLKGQRASVGADGGKPVSSNLSYGGWLKKQPIEFVDEALGVERSRLFRSGKLTIDKFVDPTGRVYTLEQLRGMNPFVFQDL